MAVAKGFTFDAGPEPNDDPFQFEVGPKPPDSIMDDLERSIMQELSRIFAPYDINVVQVAVTDLQGARDLLARNNRLTDPNQEIATTPPTNLFNLTTDATAGFVPPGFVATRVDANGAPVGTQDGYILIGSYTRGAIQVGAETGIFGTSETGGSATFNDSRAAAAGNPDPNFPGINITYSDGGGAVCADTIFDSALSGNVRANVAIAAVAAQLAGKIYSLRPTNSGEASLNHPFFNSDVDLLTSSDVMRHGPREALVPIPTGQDLPFYTRFNLMVGGTNQNIGSTTNAFNSWASNLNVGLNEMPLSQFTYNLTTTSGSMSATVASTTGLTVGEFVISANVAVGTYITGISGTTLTLSQNATATGNDPAALIFPGYNYTLTTDISDPNFAQFATVSNTIGLKVGDSVFGD